MRTDQDGNEHPAMDDVPTTEGWVHINGCNDCKGYFSTGIVNFARNVVEAMRNP